MKKILTIVTVLLSILGVFADSIKIGNSSYTLGYASNSFSNEDKAIITNDLNTIFSLFSEISSCVGGVDGDYYIESDDSTAFPHEFGHFLSVSKENNVYSFSLTEEGVLAYQHFITKYKENKEAFDKLRTLISQIDSGEIKNWPKNKKLSLIHNGAPQVNENNIDMFIAMLCNSKPKIASILEINQMNGAANGMLMLTLKAKVVFQGASMITPYPMVYHNGEWKMMLYRGY